MKNQNAGFIIYLQEWKKRHALQLTPDQDKVIEMIIRELEKGQE